MYTMKETCERVDMPYETLKFYCNEGLIRDIARNKNNHRVFTEEQVLWIESLTCLKNCGLSIAEMKHYLDLCFIGEDSIDERREMLAIKKVDLLAKLAQTQASIDYIDKKDEFYTDIQSGKIPYYSNFIKH